MSTELFAYHGEQGFRRRRHMNTSGITSSSLAIWGSAGTGRSARGLMIRGFWRGQTSAVGNAVGYQEHACFRPKMRYSSRL